MLLQNDNNVKTQIFVLFIPKFMLPHLLIFLDIGDRLYEKKTS